jgi:hypothetical protein
MKIGLDMRRLLRGKNFGKISPTMAKRNFIAAEIENRILA